MNGEARGRGEELGTLDPASEGKNSALAWHSKYMARLA